MTLKKHKIITASYNKNKGSLKSFLSTYKGKTTLVTKSKLIKRLEENVKFSSPIKNIKAYSNGILIIFLEKGGIRFLGEKVD